MGFKEDVLESRWKVACKSGNDGEAFVIESEVCTVCWTALTDDPSKELGEGYDPKLDRALADRIVADHNASLGRG